MASILERFPRSAWDRAWISGLGGIGVYLRRGPKEVFGRPVVMELPEAEALAERRQKRAWRHCRKSRKWRLHRLKLLFARHGVSWLPAERM